MVIGAITTLVVGSAAVMTYRDEASVLAASELEQDLVSQEDWGFDDGSVPTDATCVEDPEQDRTFRCAVDFDDGTTVTVRVLVRADGAWVAQPTW